jgi:cellulose synthase/poly-beta-1,6-N-acetylglucosamine synthase-like glycosyltransferase
VNKGTRKVWEILRLKMSLKYTFKITSYDNYLSRRKIPLACSHEMREVPHRSSCTIDTFALSQSLSIGWGQEAWVYFNISCSRWLKQCSSDKQFYAAISSHIFALYYGIVYMSHTLKLKNWKVKGISIFYYLLYICVLD